LRFESGNDAGRLDIAQQAVKHRRGDDKDKNADRNADPIAVKSADHALRDVAGHEQLRLAVKTIQRERPVIVADESRRQSRMGL
jgi:hypothetical protein